LIWACYNLKGLKGLKGRKGEKRDECVAANGRGRPLCLPEQRGIASREIIQNFIQNLSKLMEN
jgi:hypothetical protein